MKNVFAFLLLLLLTASTLTAHSAVIQGTVVDGQHAIIDARIVIKSADKVLARAKTGPDGTFSAALDPGQYTVEVTAVGYDKAVQTVSLTPGLAPLSFAMKAETDSSQVSDVDPELRDFLMRGTGHLKSDSLLVNLLLADTTPVDQPVSIRGTVLDDRQAAIAGAGVVVKSGNQVIAELQTGAQGIFDIPLKLGQYTVEITVAGYDRAVQTINVTADLAPLSFPMKVSQTPGR